MYTGHYEHGDHPKTRADLQACADILKNIHAERGYITPDDIVEVTKYKHPKRGMSKFTEAGIDVPEYVSKTLGLQIERARKLVAFARDQGTNEISLYDAMLVLGSNSTSNAHDAIKRIRRAGLDCPEVDTSGESARARRRAERDERAEKFRQAEQAKLEEMDKRREQGPHRIGGGYGLAIAYKTRYHDQARRLAWYMLA